MNQVPAPETPEMNPHDMVQPRLCVSGAAYCSGITPCTGCFAKIKDEVLNKALNAALTSPSQQEAFLHVFMGACVNGNEFCTGINPCEPCLIKIKNELLPTAISAMSLSSRDQALSLMQVFLGAWREMLIEFATQQMSSSGTPENVSPADAFPNGELDNVPPVGEDSTYSIEDPDGVLRQAEENQAHKGQALNGSNGHKPKPQNVVRRPKKQSQVEKKEK